MEKTIAVMVLMSSLALAVKKELSGMSVEDTVALVFKGEREFTQEDIHAVSQNSNLARYQKVILRCQMLAASETPERLAQAIGIADDFIETSEESWGRTYVQVQRGFLLKLAGKRDQGSRELEQVLRESKFEEFSEVDDPIFSAHSESQAANDRINDAIRETLGLYYLDYVATPDPAKAYAFFSGIRMPGLRDRCLKQIKTRGHNLEEAERSASTYSELAASKEESLAKFEKYRREREPRVIKNAAATSSQSEPEEGDLAVSESPERDHRRTWAIPLLVLSVVILAAFARVILATKR